MATIRFGIEDLKRYGIDEKNLDRLVASIGMEVEKLEDGEAILDITANRPDLLDITGFGRAVSLFTGKTKPKEKYYAIKNESVTEIKVADSVKKIRPFIAAFVVKKADLTGNKLKYLINFTEKFCDTYGRRRKKLAIGIHNFGMVKGPFEYKAGNETGFVPLGGTKQMSFEEVLRRHEKGKEYGAILSGSTKTYPYLKDSKNIISLVPITNSEITKVTTSTKELFIEITGTSKVAVEQTASLMACSFIDSGAEVYPCNVIYKNGRSRTPALEYNEMIVKGGAVDKTLGTVLLDENSIIGLLLKMGHYAARYGPNTLVSVPPYRLDVLDERDLIEDIAIAYGYDNIKPMPLSGFTVGMASEFTDFAERVSKIMLGLGFSEVINNYLTNEALNFEKVEHDYDKSGVVSISQSKTEAITMLRTSLLPSLLQNLGMSGHEKMPQRLFEIGKLFSVSAGKVMESDSLVIASEHSRANFSEIKSVMESLLKLTVKGNISFKDSEDRSFIKGRCAAILFGNKVIGVMGEVSPKVLDNFKIEEPVVAAEVDFQKLMLSS